MTKEVMHMDRNDAIQVLSEPKVTIEGQPKQVAMLFKAMAMGIEALKKQADPDCGWISVEDRLPDKAGSYLVAGRTGGAIVTRWYEPNEICPEGHFGGNSAGYIRYWMPRPEVPKKDGCKIVRGRRTFPYNVRFMLDEFANIGKMTSKEESDMSDELKDLLDYILNAQELDSAVYCDRMSFSELRAWQNELILKAKKVRNNYKM